MTLFSMESSQLNFVNQMSAENYGPILYAKVLLVSRHLLLTISLERH
jgi:hypothetical protein